MKNMINIFLLSFILIVSLFTGCTLNESVSTETVDVTSSPDIESPSKRLSNGDRVKHLEDIIYKAKNTSEIEGVYWTARDLDGSPLGNHHFILIIWKNKSSAELACSRYADIGATYKSCKNEKGLTIYYTTVGIGKDSDFMKVTFTSGADKQAVNEIINPDKYVKWYKPDYDCEAHEVNFWSGSTIRHPDAYYFAETLLYRVMFFVINFNKGYKAPYSLWNQNCQSWVNTLLLRLGITESTRAAIRDFAGIESGNSNAINLSLFGP